MRHGAPDAQRQARERRGRFGETVAAAWLMIRGYRILQRRARTTVGEIDIVAARGRRLAFVEVKMRRDLESARNAVTQRQYERIRRAAQAWLNRHPAYRDHEQGIDLVLVAGWRLPRHERDVYGALDNPMAVTRRF